MRAAGIDIGSRTVKVVVAEDEQVLHRRVLPNTHDPVEACRAALAGVEYERIVATGYGRHLFARYWECEVMTEIRAAALGGAFLFPSVRTLLDIGGQDTKAMTTKAMTVGPGGAVRKFEMNDRCAAGTGRFLEIMASALSYSMADFVQQALGASSSQKINSMCTVFAESEVVSMLARGAAREQLALGIHEAIAARAAATALRLSPEPDVLFCGGGALNACLGKLLGERLGGPLLIPDEPQTVAALGCALYAAREHR
jgi:(R)-2-hydroxyacyl-CoA dehydratese activating ATPase